MTERKPGRPKLSEGVKHARALEDALEYYDANCAPDDAENRYPFRAHIETVIARLQNK